MAAYKYRYIGIDMEFKNIPGEPSARSAGDAREM
jgi:hypothetical protein